MRNTRGVETIHNYPKIGKGISQSSEDGITEDFKILVDRYISEEKAPLIGGRIVIIGNSAVGKSCLMKRYFQGDFSENYKVTIGADFGQKELKIFGIDYKIQVFDTAGEEKFRALAEQFYRPADSVLICFDLGKYESLVQSKRWLEEAKKYCQKKDVNFFLVGCKSDKLNICEKNDIEMVWADIKAEYFSTSSLAGINVDECFNRATYLVFEKMLKKFYAKKKKKKKNVVESFESNTGGKKNEDGFPIKLEKTNRNQIDENSNCKCM